MPKRNATLIDPLPRHNAMHNGALDPGRGSQGQGHRNRHRAVRLPDRHGADHQIHLASLQLLAAQQAVRGRGAHDGDLGHRGRTVCLRGAEAHGLAGLATDALEAGEQRSVGVDGVGEEGRVLEAEGRGADEDAGVAHVDAGCGEAVEGRAGRVGGQQSAGFGTPVGGLVKVG